MLGEPVMCVRNLKQQSVEAKFDKDPPQVYELLEYLGDLYSRSEPSAVEENETIQLEPLYAGLAQLITLLQAIDGGLCEE